VRTGFSAEIPKTPKEKIMDNYTNLSEADKKIMDIIWEMGEVDNSDIMAALDGFRDWSRHTVKTYLRRLNEKGLVGIRQINTRKNVYYPLISKKDYMVDETSIYLKDHFKSLTHMVAGLLEREKISDEELNSLQQLIEEHKSKGK